MEDDLNLLPEHAGQADVMTMAGSGSLIEPDPDAGHWYSPAAVRVILQAAIAAEREACAKHAENQHPDDWAFIGCSIRNRAP